MAEAKKEKEERDTVIAAKDALLDKREEAMRELMEKYEGEVTKQTNKVSIGGIGGAPRFLSVMSRHVGTSRRSRISYTGKPRWPVGPHIVDTDTHKILHSALISCWLQL